VTAFDRNYELKKKKHTLVNLTLICLKALKFVKGRESFSVWIRKTN
jgi:hypothetical protein